MKNIFFPIIASITFLFPSSAMEFSTNGVNLYSGRSVIFASGDIVQGTTQKFIHFVRENV